MTNKNARNMTMTFRNVVIGPLIAGALMTAGLTIDVAAQGAQTPSRSVQWAPARPMLGPATTSVPAATTPTASSKVTSSANADADVIARVGNSSFTGGDVRIQDTGDKILDQKVQP